MGEQMEKRFTWVLKKFSSLQDQKCYSRPFAAAGCNWRLVAYRNGDKYDGDLCVYLDLASLPSGWRREVKFSLTIVNKGWWKSDLGLGGQCFFDAENKSWGYDTFVSLTKLNAKGEGFVVNNKLIIVAELHIFPAVVVPEETVNSQFNVLEDASNTVGNHGIKSNSVAAETEVSNDKVPKEDVNDEVSNDNAPKEDVNDEASSLVSNDSARNETSIDQVKDASQTVENGDIGFNTVASITETANNLLTEEVQPAKETIGVDGFDVFSAQMEKRFTWVLKKFSSLQDEVYSHPFAAAGCNWRLAAHPKGEMNGGYLCVYLELVEPSSLPSGWRREVKFSLTVVNQACAKSNIRLRAKCFFDAENDGWGCNELVSLTKLHAKDEGFVVNNKLVILAELHVFPAVVVPEETVNITEPLSSTDENQAAAAAADPSDEGTNVDGSFEEDVASSDASSPLSDDGDGDISLFSQSNALEDASHRVGTHGIKSNSVTAETEVSNENVPNEDVDDEASSLVSNDSARNGTSLDQVKSLEETVNLTEPLSRKVGNQAAAAADDPSEEGTDVDCSFEDDLDSDDASSPFSDDGDGDIRLFNQSNALEDASNTVGNHDIKSNSVTAETEVSNENAPIEDVDDDASSLVSNDSARDGTSLDQVESLEDASQTVENGGRGLNTVASITETANNVLTEEVQPAKEIVDVNGFDVFSSQVESVSHIFKRHPDVALAFRPKNQQIRRAYMNELLNLIEMLCQSPEKLSEDDLSNADDTLADLIDVGFKLDWLKTKLNEVSEKKKKEQSSGTRLRTMEEQLQKLKLMFLDLETQLQMEKAVALAARAPLSFNDVVC